MRSLRNILIGVLLAVGAAIAGTHGIQAGLTYVREFDGANAVNILSPGTSPTNANALLTTGTYYSVTAITIANGGNSATYDAGAYRMATIQPTAMGTGGALQFQQSDDNSNWTAVYGASNTFPASFSSSTTSNSGIFNVQLTSRYFRLSNSNSSGTTTANLTFTTNPVETLYTQPSTLFPTANTNAGNSIYSNTSLSNTAVAVKSTSGCVYGYHFANSNASLEYVQIFNLASGSVVLGTTTPTWTIGIPANSAVTIEMPTPIAHTSAISIAATTTPTGATAPATALSGYVKYQ